MVCSIVEVVNQTSNNFQNKETLQSRVELETS